MLIDFHTHILPGIDDGSQDAGTTEALLREEKRQGVELVAATPHFYADKMSIDGFLARREKSLERTERLRREAEIPLPAVIAGAEVHYFEGIGCAEAIARLCVGNTRTLLVELPFAQWDEAVLRDMEMLLDRQMLHVVLAHVERYAGFQKDRRVWNRVMALPLTPQINAGSFLKKGVFFRSERKRRFCLDFLAAHPRLIVGSDCHNMRQRPPNLAAARAEIAAALGAEALEGVDAAAGQALAE